PGVGNDVPDPAREDRLNRHFLGIVRVPVDVRQAVVARAGDDRKRQRGNGREQFMSTHMNILSSRGYGRTLTVKPMLRGVGIWPYSKPCTLLASFEVSGSMCRFSDGVHSQRLRPIREICIPLMPTASV